MLSTFRSDTLLTHISGIISRNPDWVSSLNDLQVEGAMMVGDWSRVRLIVNKTGHKSPRSLMAGLLLAMRNRDAERHTDLWATALSHIGAPIVAAGRYGYRRAYEAVVDLHQLQELRMIYTVVRDSSLQSLNKTSHSNSLNGRLGHRFDALLPSFKVQEPVLSMRRVAFGLM